MTGLLAVVLGGVAIVSAIIALCYRPDPHHDFALEVLARLTSHEIFVDPDQHGPECPNDHWISVTDPHRSRRTHV